MKVFRNFFWKILILTVPFTLPYLTLRLILPYLTIPYVLPYCTLPYNTLHLTFPYILPYFNNLVSTKDRKEQRITSLNGSTEKLHFAHRSLFQATIRLYSQNFYAYLTTLIMENFTNYMKIYTIFATNFPKSFSKGLKFLYIIYDIFITRNIRKMFFEIITNFIPKTFIIFYAKISWLIVHKICAAFSADFLKISSNFS